MAGKLALALVIGGAVSSSVGSAFSTVTSGIKKLEQQGNKAKVLQSTIGETMKLREEWKRAHDSGAAGADKLKRRLDSNLDALRKQGVETGRLGREYERMGRAAKSAELQMKGRAQISDGAKGLKSTAGQGLGYAAALAIPTKVSGDYQASIRQMALWAHIAGEGEEQQMADQIAKVAAGVGMGQQALASAVGGLIEKGIDWQESVDYAPIIADLIDGQGMEGETIATLFSAFKEAGVKKEDMGAMLGQVAAAGDIGAFGPKDMARYMPSLLGTIKTLGMEGPEAVRFLGASLQSQYKQTQDSAAAATNMNNLLNAVISSTSQERFAKQGIDLAGSIGRAVKTGKAANPVEAYIKLTDVLLKKQNPTKFKEVQALKKRIQESADGSAEEAQAMAALLQSAGLATIVSDQSASAGLLAQIKYGEVIKEDMATIKDTDGKAKIEGDAGKARDTSNAKWGTAKAASESALTRIGDAIRPLTDKAADVIAEVTYAIGDMVEKAPTVVAAITAIGGAFIAFRGISQTFKIGKGLINLARGKLLGGGADKDGIQKVFVTNQAGDGDEGGDEGDSRRSTVLGLLQAGLKVFKKGEPAGEDGAEDAAAADGDEDKPAGALGLVDAGLKVLEAFQGAKEGEGDDDKETGPQKVFVVNVADFNSIGSAVGGQGRGRRQGRRNGGNGRGGQRRRNRNGNGPGNDRSSRSRPPRPPRPPAPPPPPPPSRLSRIGSALGASGSKLSALGKRLPGGALLSAGMSVVDTSMTAKTQEEKAEGYGTAAGGLAGSLAGAAAGAAIGSVVPVIGTAIGGAVGAALGGMGGESLGSWLSKRLFGSDDDEAKDKEKEKDESKDAGAAVEPLTVTVKAETAPGPLSVTPIALPAVAKPSPSVVVQPAVGPASTANASAEAGQRIAAPVGLPVTPQATPLLSPLGNALRETAAAPPSPSQRPIERAPYPAPPTPFPVANSMDDVFKRVIRAPAQMVKFPDPSKQGNPPVPTSPIGNALRELAAEPPGPPQRPAERMSYPASPAPLPVANNMGDVVRQMGRAPAQMVKFPDPSKLSSPPAPKETKVDQTFTFAPSMPITVQGDVKDSAQLVRDMEPPLRRLFDEFMRESKARMASSQLFDAPHV